MIAEFRIIRDSHGVKIAVIYRYVSDNERDIIIVNLSVNFVRKNDICEY